MRFLSFIIVCILLPVLPVHGQAAKKKPVIVITDLYHPYQDPGDNLDLVMGFALPGVELKAIILDITASFRKDTADHPTLWKDPRGPREAGIIPINQLNYIFDRRVPFAMGPLELMRSETDQMRESNFVQSGIDLFMQTLRESKTSVQVVSFGSTRLLALAFNRDPVLMRTKISLLHISAGTAAPDFKLGKDQGANMIPGGEWNVAIDLHSFNRIMKSGLPIALYPCAGIDGGFVKDVNNTYWRMPNLNFLNEVEPRLQRFFDYALRQSKSQQFLTDMDTATAFKPDTASYPKPFHFWETNIWKHVTGMQLVQTSTGNFVFRKENETVIGDKIIPSSLLPVTLNLRKDGRFTFKPGNSSIRIFHRPDPELDERALQQAYPALIKSFKTRL